MNLPLAGFILILIAILGGIMAAGAFIWAIRTKQFKDMNAGAYVIFDDEEPVGKMTDNIFGSEKATSDKKGRSGHESGW